MVRTLAATITQAATLVHAKTVIPRILMWETLAKVKEIKALWFHLCTLTATIEFLSRSQFLKQFRFSMCGKIVYVTQK